MRKRWTTHTEPDAVPAAAPKPATPKRARDPWYSNDEHVRDVNDESPRAAPRWFPRWPAWLRR